MNADPFRLKIKLPEDFVMPPGGLNARLTTETLGIEARKQEALMQNYNIYAALAYARANQLNRTTIDGEYARLGIIASDKSYLDVLGALEGLGTDEKFAGEIGIRLYKVSMPWPLEPDGVREFTRGLDEILVVEEKRQIVEYQLKEQLYNWREDVRLRVIGKFDEKGEWVHPRGERLLTSKADFSVSQIARVIAARIARFHTSDLIKARLAFLEAKDVVLKKTVDTPTRSAYYCSGCSHNTSTKVPEGSLALAGIGCHVMATAIYPEHNKTTTHMGGEGAPWIGPARFSHLPHVFANLGDGTYFHSGYLAMAVAKYVFKLMANKDEYQVARLYTDGAFMEKLQAQFEGDFSVQFNLAPPLFSKQDSAGHLVKVQYGSWVWRTFKLLARLKFLRGTALDIFGYTAERSAQRALSAHYQNMVRELCAGLLANNLNPAIALATLPEQVRGYGHIKERAMVTYYQQTARLRQETSPAASRA